MSRARVGRVRGAAVRGAQCGGRVGHHRLCAARGGVLNPLLRQVRTTHGDEYSYAKKCLVATGARPPRSLHQVSWTNCVDSVRCLGHGEAADAAAVRDAFSVAKRGSRAWSSVARGSMVALAAAVASGPRRRRRPGSPHLSCFPRRRPSVLDYRRTWARSSGNRWRGRHRHRLTSNPLRRSERRQSQGLACRLSRAGRRRHEDVEMLQVTWSSAAAHAAGYAGSARDARSAPRGSTAGSRGRRRDSTTPRDGPSSSTRRCPRVDLH